MAKRTYRRRRCCCTRRRRRCACPKTGTSVLTLVRSALKGKKVKVRKS